MRKTRTLIRIDWFSCALWLVPMDAIPLRSAVMVIFSRFTALREKTCIVR